AETHGHLRAAREQRYDRSHHHHLSDSGGGHHRPNLGRHHGRRPGGPPDGGGRHLQRWGGHVGHQRGHAEVPAYREDGWRRAERRNHRQERQPRGGRH